jgi:Tol biopolymer transport system component
MPRVQAGSARIAPPADVAIREELARVLASDLFSHTHRLRTFLQFVVERTLDGQGDALKEQVLAFELYGKEADFNTASDAKVRVDARRLRDKLREYYATVPDAPVIISIPKGSYTPAFHVPRALPRPLVRGRRIAQVHDVVRRCLRRASEQRVHDIADARRELLETLVASSSPSSIRRVLYLSAAVLVLVMAFTLLWWRRSAVREPVSAVRVVPFTTFAGWEGSPAFSPDGAQVAFVWNKGTDTNLYIKLAAGGEPRQLTSVAGAANPAWSPDGTRIAFLRDVNEEHGVFVIPALGGAEHRLTTRRSQGSGLAWADGGRSLVIVDRLTLQDPDALFLFSTDTGERKRLTDPPRRGHGDRNPRVSPDGRTIAFVRRSENQVVCDVYLVPAAGGEARRLTSVEWNIFDLDWTADGQAIVLAGGSNGEARLWRARVPEGNVSPIAFGEGAGSVNISRTGNRLAYSQQVVDSNIWRAPGPAAVDHVRPASFLASTRLELLPRYSPDGRRVSFISDRTGEVEVWTCNAEAAQCEALVGLGSAVRGPAEWSPASDRVTFTRRSSIPGRPEIHVAEVASGLTHRITESSVRGVGATWSADGQWLYFNVIRDEDSSAERQIWKMPVAGGPARLATNAKGRYPRSSDDGRFLYYIKGTPNGPIWRVNLESGEETRIVDHPIFPFDWSLWENSLVYVRTDANRHTSISRLDLASGQTQELMSLGNDVRLSRGLTVSPDGRWILYVQEDAYSGDINLVENYR